MKKKTIALRKKLSLDKAVITALDSKSMQALAGGATVTDNGCVGSNHCDIRYTQGNRDCTVTAQRDICLPNTFKCLP